MQYDLARYYDPGTAQFLTRDPLSPITQQPYAYAANDPVTVTDPTGMLSFSDVLQGVGVGAVCLATDGAGCVAAGLTDLDANVVSNDIHAAVASCTATTEAVKSFDQVVGFGIGTGIGQLATAWQVIAPQGKEVLEDTEAGRAALAQLKTLSVTSGTLGSLAYAEGHAGGPASACSCVG